MKQRVWALLGAFLTLSAVYAIAGFSFGSVFAEDAPSGPLVLPIVGFAISNLLLVLFFSWVSDQMNHPIKAGLTVAVSQLLLVDVDYVLGGNRGIVAGLLSATTLVVGWTLVGIVYRVLQEQSTSTAPA